MKKPHLSSGKIYKDKHGTILIEWDYVVTVLRGHNRSGGKDACLMADTIYELSNESRIVIYPPRINRRQ